MATVNDLIPGDLVRLADRTAVFVQRCPHPFYPGLAMVIWRLGKGHGPFDPVNGSWSHDALRGSQEIGDIEPATPAERRERLRLAIFKPEVLRD